MSLQSFTAIVSLNDEGNKLYFKPKESVILDLYCYFSKMPLVSAVSLCSLIKLVHLNIFSAMKDVLKDVVNGINWFLDTHIHKYFPKSNS